MMSSMTYATNRNDKQIQLTISIYGRPMTFRRDFESEAVALIVSEAICEANTRRIRDIRQDAYELGKKAARNKKLRVTLFCGDINRHEVGW
jgi:hypothetical protein